MIKIAHEAPLSIFEAVQAVTDYDYALVHLFDESEAYFNKFIEAKNKGREIILDNSLYELGYPYDGEKYVNWINKLEPTFYVIPDYLGDSVKSWQNIEDYAINNIHNINSNVKTIGVVQGKTYEEICVYYLKLKDHVDMIAFPMLKPFKIDELSSDESRLFNRFIMINKMYMDGVLDITKNHHLLGCQLPFEFSLYNRAIKSCITSVDTTNPVLEGIEYRSYPVKGPKEKSPTKIFTLINESVDDFQAAKIFENIKIFRNFVMS